MDLSPDGIGVYSGDVFLFANEAGARLLGTTPEQVVGRPVLEFVNPEFRDAVKERMRRVLESREAITLHHAQIVRVDGSVRDVEVIEVPIMYQGKPAGQLVTRDVTERMQLQQAVKKSEANFRAIFNSMNDAVFVHDTATGAILDVNSKMCEMYGYSVEEARLLSLEDLSYGDPPYTQKEAFRLIGEVVQGKPQLFEWQAKTKDGRPFWVEVNLKRSLINERDVVLAVVRDITDRKKAEEALRKSEARFRDFAEAVPQVVYEADTRGKFTFFNRTGLELYGYTQEDVDRGLPVTDLIVPEDHERIFEDFKKVLQGESASGRTYTAKARDGTRVPVVCYSSPMVGEDKVIGVRGVCVDIRKMKEAEEVLKRSRDELERLVAERTADLELSNKQLRQEILEKIQAQEALAESEGRFRAIFETTPDCVFIKDLFMRYAMVNPSMETLMVLPGSTIVGKTDRDLFDAEAAAHLKWIDVRVLGGEVVESEHTRKVKGSQLTFLDVKAPLTNKYGEVVGLCGISRNITCVRQSKRGPLEVLMAM